MHIKTSRWLPLVWAFLIPFTASLRGQDPQVVVTVPVETDLAVPGVAETKDVWLQLIDSARETLDFEQFYLSHKPGEALEPILTAIRRAVKERGVKVRFLVDQTFLAKESGGRTELIDTPGIEVRSIDYSKCGGGVQHSKFFVVDGKTAFFGSANFDWRALSHIHETGLKTEDLHVVQALVATFEKDWARGNRLGSQTVNPVDRIVQWGLPAAMRFVASPIGDLIPKAESTWDALGALLTNSTQTVQIMLMEYSTYVYATPRVRWLEMERALIEAANRGVKIQLLVDGSKVARNERGLTILTEKGVEVRAVSLPQASMGPIPFARLVHSKFMLVDGARYWLGTDNWAKGYFYGSRGVGVVADNAATTGTLARVFDAVWHSQSATSVGTPN